MVVKSSCHALKLAGADADPLTPLTAGMPSGFEHARGMMMDEKMMGIAFPPRLKSQNAPERTLLCSSK